MCVPAPSLHLPSTDEEVVQAVYTCIWNCSSKHFKELSRVVNAAIVVCKAVIT